MNSNSSNCLVLLRGLVREKGHWGDFPQRVSEILPSRKIVSVDLPGVGENASVRPPFGTFGMAEFVHQKIKEQCLKEGPVDLCALSLGGMVALELKAFFPHDYSKVMTVNTSSRLSRPSKRLRKQNWKTILKAAMEMNPVRREEVIVSLVVNSPEGQAQALDTWSKIAKERKQHPLLFLAQLRAASKFKPADSLKNSSDILLISSLGDLLVDPSCSELLHNRYGWKQRKHPWGGHDLAWDDSTWLLSEIQEFFS